MRNKSTIYKFSSGFTLIELLVVIAIIGILTALSIFGLQNARSSARDAKRKSDLEAIRSALEIYKADCNVYPTTLNLSSSTSIIGSGTCANTYMAATPVDPLSPTSNYVYTSPTNQTYNICATLEQAPTSTMYTSACGSCGTACNYIVTNP